jgi:plastocyanin domain-containing protein
MTTIDLAVLLAGLAAILWVNWYFFIAPRRLTTSRRGAEATTSAGRQEALIVVHGGYEPATIRVKSGSPVRLIFDRQETNSCSEEIVFPDFNIRRYLPAFERTTVDLPAPSPGEHPFMCGMSMLHGRLIAE